MSLGVAFGGMRGKLGNVVIVPTSDGVTVRERVKPHNPQTSAQMIARSRQTKAMRAWRALPDAAHQAWCAYAQSLAAPSPRTGLMVAPRPDNLFTAHYSPMLLVDPTTLPPQTPPAQAFFGDVIAVTATGGASGVTFTATAPNAAGIVTELRIQPLDHDRRKVYLDKYRHAAVATFTSTHLTETVPLAPGWYACAYKFIKASTGQTTELAQIGIVQVA